MKQLNPFHFVCKSDNVINIFSEDNKNRFLKIPKYPPASTLNFSRKLLAVSTHYRKERRAQKSFRSYLFQNNS